MTGVAYLQDTICFYGAVATVVNLGVNFVTGATHMSVAGVN